MYSTSFCWTPYVSVQSKLCAYADSLYLVVIFVSGGVGGLAETFQQEWMQVLQKRVGITSTMLSAMKGVKMTGLTPKLGELIQDLRLGELKTAKKFRKCFTAFLVLGMPPIIFILSVTQIMREMGYFYITTIYPCL
jgi:hypothetical protein